MATFSKLDNATNNFFLWFYHFYHSYLLRIFWVKIQKYLREYLRTYYVASTRTHHVIYSFSHTHVLVWAYMHMYIRVCQLLVKNKIEYSVCTCNSKQSMFQLLSFYIFSFLAISFRTSSRINQLLKWMRKHNVHTYIHIWICYFICLYYWRGSQKHIQCESID